MKDNPKSLSDPSIKAHRVKLLRQKHILQLTNFVDAIRKEQGLTKEVPYFDPLDGGVNAGCLFVLESPGRKAVESGFISRNNPDETAKNFSIFNKSANLPRTKTVIWNIIPWYIGTGKKIRAAKIADIKAGLQYLNRIIKLLPDLKIVVLMGKSAQHIKSELQRNGKKFTLLACPHPSPMFVNRARKNGEEIVNQLKQVRQLLK